MLACDIIFDNFGMTTLQAQKDIKVANQLLENVDQIYKAL